MDKNDFPQERISIDILELTEDRIKFVLNNCDLSFANTLRRMMISEVPTMAIEFVHINNNTSALHDEFLAQRLGLVPLETEDIEKFVFFMNCTQCTGGFGCDSCTVIMNLKVKNTTDQVLDVTSAHLISESDEVRPAKFFSAFHKNQEGNPKETGILIAKLKKEQEIDLQCIARKGIAKDHAKFSPVATAKFRYEPIIELNTNAMETITQKQKEDFVKSCPTKVYELNPNGKIEVANLMNCMFCDECVRACEDWKHEDPFVKVSMKKHKYIFEVETTGSMRPEDVVRHALKELTEKLRNIKGVCETTKSGMTANR